jgi:carboxylesterase
MLFAPTLWLNGWVVPAYAALFRLVLQKPVANLFDFPDLPPHGIKDPEIRALVAAAVHNSDGSSGAGLPITPGGAVIEHRWLVDNVRPRLKHVDQPVLIMHPREDDYADLNNIAYLMRNLAGPVETHTLDDCYHIITTDRQRRQVIERSLDYLARIFASAGRDRLRGAGAETAIPDYLLTPQRRASGG